MVQVGSKIVAKDEFGPGLFGGAVALSGDGKTALLGGQADDNDTGAAWIFTLSGGVWTQQGAKLVAPGGPAEGDFGESVALSGDGNTALVGEPQLDDMAAGPGFVWVYTRVAGNWKLASKLTASDEAGNGAFGSSVSLSGDGDIALIGGRNDSSAKGAAWVFKRAGSTWTQEGAKLAAGDELGPGLFGTSVALSGDGSTALVGGLNDAGTTGAAWVFTVSGGVWTQQGAKLTGGGEVGGGLFGVSVALSRDGNSALVGGYADRNGIGAAWVFGRAPDGTWAQQGAKLTATGERGAGSLGTSVALSSDGNAALVAAPFDNGRLGAAWLFTHSGSSWAQGSKLTGTHEIGAGLFGTGVALSSDGSNAIVGGREDDDEDTDAPALRRNAGLGAAWAFTSATQAASDIIVSAAAPRTAGVGTKVAIAFKVTNRGPSADSGLTLSSTTTGGPAAVISTPHCALQAAKSVCSVGRLVKGASGTAGIAFTPTKPGTYTTIVTVAGSQPDLGESRIVSVTKITR